jgi:putative aminopeptidase FrvX
VGKFVRKSFLGQCCKIYFDGGKECIGVVGINAEEEIEFVWGQHDE